MSLEAQIAIRTRKLGVLLRDAREISRKTLPETAKATGISPVLLRSYEEGHRSPALPELEVLSYFLGIPIQHFWSSQILPDDSERVEPLSLDRISGLRHRIIGVLLRIKRQQTSVSLKALAAETGIPQSRLKDYETAEKPIPLAELEAILTIIGGRVENFFDQNSAIGQWMTEQQAVSDFLQLPPELRAFVCLPVNRPYLDLARNLSQLSTEKLRAVAEGLLDITL